MLIRLISLGYFRICSEHSACEFKALLFSTGRFVAQQR